MDFPPAKLQLSLSNPEPEPGGAEDMLQVPWSFTSRLAESEFYRDKARQWSRSGDQLVALPWTLLWVSIIARHWATLPTRMLLRSFSHLCVITAPAYLRTLLGQARYERLRTPIVCMAILSYVFHPGGGLYRDAVVTNVAEHTGLDALNLFVRLVVGSRTLFWLILVMGYSLPPTLGISLNALGLALMARLKPSAAFCAVLQTPAARPLFQAIAANLPLVGLLPMLRPRLADDADICNPLVMWVQLAFGLVLPAAVQLCADFHARRAFARRHASQLAPQDRAAWLNGPTTAFVPASLAVLVYVHAIAALWYAVTWRQALPH